MNIEEQYQEISELRKQESQRERNSMNSTPPLEIMLRKLSLTHKDDDQDAQFAPLLVGVAGGSASGKTTLCNQFKEELEGENCHMISMDSYYKGLGHDVDASEYNFDHPDALDFDLMYQHIIMLLNRQTVHVPIYCFKTHSRLTETITIQPTDIILFEGILALYDKRLNDLMTFKIFVHCDDDIRLCRRIKRDILERGREVQGILYQYSRFVKRSFDEFVKPTMNYADIIVPGSRPNQVSVKFIVQNLKAQLLGIIKIKAYLKTTLVYHGDELENLWLIPSDSNIQTNDKLSIYMKKQLIFEDEYVEKKFFRHSFANFSHQYKYKVLENVMKQFLKHCLQMFSEYIKNKSISMTQIHYLQDYQLQFGDQQYILLIVPYIHSQEFDKISQLVNSLTSNQNIKNIYLLNVLSTMNYMTKLGNMDPRLIIFNIMCVSNNDRLIKTLYDNCQDKKDMNNRCLLQLQSMKQCLNKTIQKFMDK